MSETVTFLVEQSVRPEEADLPEMETLGAMPPMVGTMARANMHVVSVSSERLAGRLTEIVGTLAEALERAHMKAAQHGQRVAHADVNIVMNSSAELSILSAAGGSMGNNFGIRIRLETTDGTDDS